MKQSHVLTPFHYTLIKDSRTPTPKLNKSHSFPTCAVGLESFTSQHHSASVNLPLTCYNGYNPNYTCHSGSW